MPPHLHPRSRMTSSLFATTLLASFFVVALPHILPCPVPRTKFADGEVVVDENGRRRRWRRNKEPSNHGNVETTTTTTTAAAAGGRSADDSSGLVQFDQAVGSQEAGRERRECPVPKPGGMLGEWLGFQASEERNRPER